MKTMDKTTYSLIENYMISCMEDSAPSFFREYKYKLEKIYSTFYTVKGMEKRN